MNKYAIIVAGGRGRRMGSAIPKQFLIVKDKPVLYYTVKAFIDSYNDINIILVLPGEYMDMGKEIIDAYFNSGQVQITSGGDTRFHSVQNGLRLVNKESIIFVHDAVRCLVSIELIQKCYEHTLQMGSAVPVIRAKDSVRYINEEDNDNEVIERDRIVLVQTPQTFHSKILLPAYQIDYKERFTDEATVIEEYGLKISLVEGEEQNIKITRSHDLLIAEAFLIHAAV